MGCGASLSPEQQEQKARSQEIDQALRRSQKEMKQEVKILLLGAGSSGKSTIVKQMRLLYLEGFSEKESVILREIVFFNIIKSMKTLVMQADRWGIPVHDESLRAFSSELCRMTLQLTDVELTEERTSFLQRLWADEGIQQVVARSSEFQFEDSAPYFFDNLERISKDGYVPNKQDILRVRAKTTGVVETEFYLEGFEFKVVDVGGQRNERRKWIHTFEDVTAVIFVVGTSEYDQSLEEDMQTNRMKESLDLFSQMSNASWFSETPFILFLNKKDLFEAKIKKRSLTVCFPDYDGKDHDYEAGMGYIRDQFYKRNKVPTATRPVYSHYTCATDTENISVVLTSVTEILLQANLKGNGLY